MILTTRNNQHLWAMPSLITTNCLSGYFVIVNPNASFQNVKKMDPISLNIEAGDIVFFDMDGTLIDTDACNTKAYKAAIEVVLGCGYAELFDVTRIERRVLKERLSWVSEEQLSRIVALKEAYYTQLIDEISIIPSTMAILERFRATNKIVLVTNARRQRTIQTLRHLGLEGKFDGIITKDDCGCVDKFTTALERFDLNPQNVWVFENEEVQVMAAVAAGININHIILG